MPVFGDEQCRLFEFLCPRSNANATSLQARRIPTQIPETVLVQNGRIVATMCSMPDGRLHFRSQLSQCSIDAVQMRFFQLAQEEDHSCVDDFLPPPSSSSRKRRQSLERTQGSEGHTSVAQFPAQTQTLSRVCVEHFKSKTRLCSGRDLMLRLERLGRSALLQKTHENSPVDTSLSFTLQAYRRPSDGLVYVSELSCGGRFRCSSMKYKSWISRTVLQWDTTDALGPAQKGAVDQFYEDELRAIVAGLQESMYEFWGAEATLVMAVFLRGMDGRFVLLSIPKVQFENKLFMLPQLTFNREVVAPAFRSSLDLRRPMSGVPLRRSRQTCSEGSSAWASMRPHSASRAFSRHSYCSEEVFKNITDIRGEAVLLTEDEGANAFTKVSTSPNHEEAEQRVGSLRHLQLILGEAQSQISLISARGDHSDVLPKSLVAELIVKLGIVAQELSFSLEGVNRKQHDLADLEQDFNMMQEDLFLERSALSSAAKELQDKERYLILLEEDLLQKERALGLERNRLLLLEESLLHPGLNGDRTERTGNVSSPPKASCSNVADDHEMGSSVASPSEGAEIATSTLLFVAGDDDEIQRVAQEASVMLGCEDDADAEAEVGVDSDYGQDGEDAVHAGGLKSSVPSLHVSSSTGFAHSEMKRRSTGKASGPPVTSVNTSSSFSMASPSVEARRQAKSRLAAARQVSACRRPMSGHTITLDSPSCRRSDEYLELEAGKGELERLERRLLSRGALLRRSSGSASKKS